MYYSHIFKMVAGVGFEPHDLQVMSLTSYQAALSRDNKINGGERGIRTPAPLPTSWFSRPVPSTGLGYFSVSFNRNKLIIA